LHKSETKIYQLQLVLKEKQLTQMTVQVLPTQMAIASASRATSPTLPHFFGILLSSLLGILALIAPYIILKALTGFESGNNTTPQRVWTMVWLVVGTDCRRHLKVSGSGQLVWKSGAKIAALS